MAFTGARRFLSALKSEIYLCSFRRPLPVCLRPAQRTYVNGGGGGINEEFLSSQPGIRAKVLDGKRLAGQIQKEIRDDVKQMTGDGRRPPHLVAVLVGDDAASSVYVSNKTKAAQMCEITATTKKLHKDTTQEELLDLVQRLNMDKEVDGILVQLPLPSHIDEKTICYSVTPEKDVDGFHYENIGRYCAGEPERALIPATPLGVLEIIKRCNIPTFGKNVCIAGRSKNIGFTLMTLLHSDGTGDATTTMCHRYTPPEQLPVMTKPADIVIVATGVTHLIKADMVKEGAAVIDVGITRVKTASGETKLIGDVDFDSVAQKASIITPVPGGVGPLTVAMVIRNTLYAAQKDFRFEFKSIYE